MKLNKLMNDDPINRKLRDKGVLFSLQKQIVQEVKRPAPLPTLGKWVKKGRFNIQSSIVALSSSIPAIQTLSLSTAIGLLDSPLKSMARVGRDINAFKKAAQTKERVQEGAFSTTEAERGMVQKGRPLLYKGKSGLHPVQSLKIAKDVFMNKSKEEGVGMVTNLFRDLATGPTRFLDSKTVKLVSALGYQDGLLKAEKMGLQGDQATNYAVKHMTRIFSESQPQGATAYRGALQKQEGIAGEALKISQVFTNMIQQNVRINYKNGKMLIDNLKTADSINGVAKGIARFAFRGFMTNLLPALGIGLIRSGRFLKPKERGKEITEDALSMVITNMSPIAWLGQWNNVATSTISDFIVHGETNTRSTLRDNLFTKTAMDFAEGSERMIKKGEWNWKDGDKVVRSLGAIMAIPYGNGVRPIRGIQAYQQGKSVTATGRKRFDIEKDWQNAISTAVWGEWAAPGAYDYLNRMSGLGTDKKKKKKKKRVIIVK